MGSTFFRYFYLRRTAPINILAALEVVDPKLDLTSKLSWPVLPADTVKVLLQNPGLVQIPALPPVEPHPVRNRIDDARRE